jgi:hypothetical protein
MKKLAILAVAVLALTFLATNSNAQSQTKGNHGVVKINWVDLNGDGICDNVGTSVQGTSKAAKGFGKKDGSGNPVRPMDGTGYGSKNGNLTGTGTCTGTGPQGTSARGYRGGK